MFSKSLLRSDVEYITMEYMLGRKIDYIKSSYYKNNPTDLRQKYFKGLKNIY